MDTRFLTNKIKALRKEVEELKAQLALHRWIPVGERLPEESGLYHVVMLDVAVSMQPYHADIKEWPGAKVPVTHWKPIILP